MMRALLLLLNVTLLGGCDQVTAYLDEGTTIGFQRCLERGKNSPLNQLTVREQCTQQIERPMPIEIWGSGRYTETYIKNTYNFEISITNKSKDAVLTSVRVYLVRENKEETQSYLLKNLWVEPGFSSSYIFTADQILTQPKSERLKADGGWGALEMRGIKIKI